MQYVLMGNPVPLARPRFNYSQRNPRVYDSQSEQKLIMGISLAQQHGNMPFYTGPLILRATFYLPLAKSMSRRKAALYEDTPHYQRPDTDNLIKMILDCAQSVLFHNDSAVAIIDARKVYSSNPRTVFTLEEIK